MRLHLINPSNPLVSIVKVKESRWNRYRVWKPLSLMVLAGLTPPEWEISIVDENLGVPDYPTMFRPDLVGITALTSQANRAYGVATHFRRLGIPVVMGGIHATMCLNEVTERVNSVVTGEAEGIWPQVLEDARHGRLKRRYDGGLAEISEVPIARHDLLDRGYACGAIQTTRGCPLNCNFCSVTAFNGAHYRQRSIADVVREFKLIREKHVLVVDDNLIGTRHEHIARAKDLFRAMAQANLRKQWVAQASINFADDEELLTLAAKVIDLALKVYVYYCNMPSPAKAESLIPRLNGAIDTPIIRHLFKRLEDIYGKPYPPHYLWTIKMINKEDYDSLQKVIRQDIKDSFDDYISPVQYDDIMWRQINR